MRWRDSAGLIFAVLVLLGLGAQPVARWIVTRAVSSYVQHDPLIAGTVSWDPVGNTWTCNDFRVGAGTGGSVHVTRATVRVDSSALFRRNLVIDSAKVDGLNIRLPDEEEDLRRAESSASPENRMGVVPAFSAEAWSNQFMNPFRSQVLSVAQRRENRRYELRQEWERIQNRARELETALNPNPLRKRVDVQEFRRDMAKLIQAFAEERIIVRETSRDLDRGLARLEREWMIELGRSIDGDLPESSHWVQQLADRCLVQYWDARRPWISYAVAATLPLQESPPSARGREIPIPGLPRNYVMIRSVHVSGSLETEDRNKIRFRGSIRGWGDPSCALDPTSEWEWEVPDANAISVVKARIERPHRVDDGSVKAPAILDRREGLLITWQEHSNPDRTSRGHWRSTSWGDRFELAIPIESLAELSRTGDVIAFDGSSEWMECWDQAIAASGGEYLHASLPLGGRSTTGRWAGSWKCSDPEMDRESFARFTQIWEATLATYRTKMTERMRPRIRGLIDAMEQFRLHGWTDGVPGYLDALEDLERDAVALQDRWAESDRSEDRWAERHPGNEDF
jgi:hypothetical protein